MELSNIDFKYDIKQKAFSAMRYNFMLEPTDDAAQIVKKQFNELETILDKHYCIDKMIKDDTGSIEQYHVQAGYIYMPEESKEFSIFKQLVIFHYDIKLNTKNEVNDVKIYLSCDDGDEKRLMEIYDIIIGMPVDLSVEAKDSKSKIESLRKGVQGNYLEILQ